MLKIGRKIHLVPYAQITNRERNVTLACKYYQGIFTGKHQIVIGYYDKVMIGSPSNFFFFLKTYLCSQPKTMSKLYFLSALKYLQPVVPKLYTDTQVALKTGM